MQRAHVDDGQDHLASEAAQCIGVSQSSGVFNAASVAHFEKRVGRSPERIAAG
jgi:hypothetical protein